MTWRRLGVLNRLLAHRQEALAWPSGHPPQIAVEDWAAQLERDNDRVVRASTRVQDLQARLQAAWDTRQAELAAGKVFRGAPLVPVEANSRLARERKALQAASQRAARTAANRVGSRDPDSWGELPVVRCDHGAVGRPGGSDGAAARGDVAKDVELLVLGHEVGTWLGSRQVTASDLMFREVLLDIMYRQYVGGAMRRLPRCQ